MTKENTIQFSPQQVLKKHIDLSPKLTIAMSISYTGQSVIDISSPGNIAELLFLREMLNTEIARMFQSMRDPDSKGPGPDHIKLA
jgi:hypothetical protein